MSYITFSTIDDSARVSGADRKRFSRMLESSTLAILCSMSDSELKKHLPKNSYLQSSTGLEFKRDFNAWFAAGDESLVLDGQEVTPLVVTLNTCALMGSDQINLMACVDGQCEVHGYFMPEDFDFFAEVIRDGLHHKIFRESEGWNDVLRLFETAKTEIVTSSSLRGDFPNPRLCNLSDKEFDTMPPVNVWNIAVDSIKAQYGGTLRIAKKRRLFGFGISAFDFVNR